LFLLSKQLKWPAQIDDAPRTNRRPILGGSPTTPEGLTVSKKTKKRKLKSRRNKANHGRKPNAGR
jgi:hypothetical protein